MNKHWLITRCHDLNDKLALIYNDKDFKYSDIYNTMGLSLSFLNENNIEPGSIVSLEGDFTLYSCAMLLALINNKNIIVPIGDVPDKRKDGYILTAQVKYRIKTQNDSYRLETTGQKPEHPLYFRLLNDNSSGLVLFSSGTTGQPKASVLDFDKLIDKHQPMKLARRTISFLSIDHIGGINTLLHTISQGGALVIPHKRTPESVFSAIYKWNAEVLPTTPTFLNMVLISRIIESGDYPSLKLITYGTEPMPPIILNKLNKLLPQVKLKQTYGLSEVGILPTKSKNDSELWVKLGNSGFDYKVIENILWIKSDFAMLGYLNADAPFDNEGYFNTQDIVEMNGEYIKILGRKSEIINVGGEKVYPAEVEDVLLQSNNISDVTVVGCPSPITGECVKAIIYLSKPEKYDDLRSRLFKHCKEHLEEYKIPMLFEISKEPHHSTRFKKQRSAFQVTE
ncbi:acyl-CoA synthetase (AMP-forming)/AMP-acid ligase II [Serratia sp. FGI94]|uniref:ANL family adenylate-forming protein n=1 Tax=Serratia sp. FGI94 TaxID=671990 RepID=UPI0002A70230|nr:fatty acid--CoA ligase family protein [Serratia sp. FGI94]AGB83995.1 acyl-CoA synthetase (AMP-forming)/AMP-acid ligase II [Serratia sp. FGI94]